MEARRQLQTSRLCLVSDQFLLRKWWSEIVNYLASSAALGQVWHHTGYYPPPPHGQLTQEAASSKQSGLINSEVHHPVCPVSIMPVWRGIRSSARSITRGPVQASEDTIYWFHSSRAAQCPADKKRLISCLIFSREKWLLICMSYWTRATRNLPTQRGGGCHAAGPAWPETNGTICYD